MPTKSGDEPKGPATELLKPRRGLPLWLWMPLLTLAIVAVLLIVGRNSFAA